MAVPKLIVLSEQFRGKTFELTKELYTIGRVDERDICLPDPTVSSFHCSLIRRGDKYLVRDQGSTNGTRINFKPVSEDQELQNCDVLQIGGIEILFDCAEKTGTTILKTATNININAASGAQSLERMERAGITEKKVSNKGQKILIFLLIVLGLVVLGLAAFLVMMITNPEMVKGIF